VGGGGQSRLLVPADACAMPQQRVSVAVWVVGAQLAADLVDIPSCSSRLASAVTGGFMGSCRSQVFLVRC
jgi:hypothetical protein